MLWGYKQTFILLKIHAEIVEKKNFGQMSNLTLKEPEGGGIRPLNIFCYISAGCYFFALKLHDFFSSSLALNLRPFFKNRT